jgi:hypothetical protein
MRSAFASAAVAVDLALCRAVTKRGLGAETSFAHARDDLVQRLSHDDLELLDPVGREDEDFGRAEARVLVGVNDRDPGAELVCETQGVVESCVRGLAEVVRRPECGECRVWSSRFLLRAMRGATRIEDPVGS